MRVVLWIFAVIGLLSTLFTVLLIVAVVHLGSKVETLQMGPGPKTVGGDTVLYVDLERPITESPPQGLDVVWNDRTTGFATLLSALKRASTDQRIKGLVARAGSVELGLAQSQEFRDAIKEFRASGKFAYAFADSFGEISGGTRSYYVASAFDQIWLQPAGSLALTGVASEIPFFKGAFDKLGITPQFERRGEFKTAASEYTDTKLAATDRTAMTGLIGSIYDQLSAGIAEGRKLPPDHMKALIDGGPYSGEEALAQHLVDHMGYQDEAEDAARRQAGSDGPLMNVTAYAAAANRGVAATHLTPSIAVIRAVGLITSGRSDASPFGNSNNVGADTMSRAFDEAVRDRNIKSIVFRIESPGGSEVASETIWRAVKRAQQAGKPVIVSMSDEAASGGYYIAAPADKIVAEPMTLTGSIGVYSGKFVTAGLWDKLGVSWDTVAVGKNSEMGGSLAPFTPDQQQRFSALIDLAYKGFLTRVADGRHLDVSAVDSIARGRVWTGAQAKENGLVDALGGFDVAIRYAKAAAHLPPDEPAGLKEFPVRRSPVQALFEGLMEGEGPAEAFSAVQELAALAPMLRELQAVSSRSELDTTMRPVEIGR